MRASPKGMVLQVPATLSVIVLGRERHYRVVIVGEDQETFRYRAIDDIHDASGLVVPSGGYGRAYKAFFQPTLTF